jgi:hypothetical protein
MIQRKDQSSPWQYPWGFLRVRRDPLSDEIEQACVRLEQPAPSLNDMSVNEMVQWVSDRSDPVLFYAVWRNILTDLGMEIEEI